MWTPGRLKTTAVAAKEDLNKEKKQREGKRFCISHYKIYLEKLKKVKTNTMNNQTNQTTGHTLHRQCEKKSITGCEQLQISAFVKKFLSGNWLNLFMLQDVAEKLCITNSRESSWRLHSHMGASRSLRVSSSRRTSWPWRHTGGRTEPEELDGTGQNWTDQTRGQRAIKMSVSSNWWPLRIPPSIFSMYQKTCRGS